MNGGSIRNGNNSNNQMNDQKNVNSSLIKDGGLVERRSEKVSRGDVNEKIKTKIKTKIKKRGLSCD
jgi:hypothetical protein